MPHQDNSPRTQSNQNEEALDWQVGVWDHMSKIYVGELEQRLAPVVDALLARAQLNGDERVLDLGTGTGSVAAAAAPLVGPGGTILGVDVSPDMLKVARQRISTAQLEKVEFLEGQAESIPAEDDSFDVVLAGLSLMFVIDREKAAAEIGRVLRPGGRLVATVWAGPESCDVVLFQQTAGRFAGPPPAPGAGPGALADPRPFLRQLTMAGIDAEVEVQTLGFEFPDFDSAWNALAMVTTAGLPLERQEEAKAAVKAAMPNKPTGSWQFSNEVQLITGQLRDTSP